MSLKITKLSSYSRSEFKKLVKEAKISVEELRKYLTSMAYSHTIDGCFITYLLEEIVDDNKILIGYISFSNTVIESQCQEAKNLLDVSVNMKYPIPTLKITRLAICDEYQGKGFGKILIAFAELKAFIQQKDTGCKALVVDSKNSAIKFYESTNFIPIKNYSDDNTMFMIKKIATTKELRKNQIFEETIKNYAILCDICNLGIEKQLLLT